MTHHPEPEPTQVIHPPLPPEPATRRIRQQGLMIGAAVLVVVCTVWLLWSYFTKAEEAEQSQAAATKLCRQVNRLGQPCATRAPDTEGVSGDAQLPAPTASLTGTPLTPATRNNPTAPPLTDEAGIPLAYQPGPDALIVSVNVSDGRLILTFDDGARVDAGPVNEETLAIVLRQVPSVSPSPSPSPVPESSSEDSGPSDTTSPPGDPTPQEIPS
jgi:hypothetical protein